jgi:hypothetical protein
MLKRIAFCLLLVAGLSLLASAAAIDGKWIAQVPGRDGQTRETTFTFKAEGDKLTGSMSGRNGDIQIADGKITGDDISFTVTQNFNGNEMKRAFTGKVAGDEIKMKRAATEQAQSVEFAAKRVK